jgi:plasmid stabilization system protein ParE
MSLPVVLSPRADLQLDEITGWWGENRSAEQAERWLAGIVAAIKSLPESPLRYALAGENELFPFEIRELH